MRLGKEIMITTAIVLAGCLPALAQSTQVNTDSSAKGSCAAKAGAHRFGRHHGVPFSSLEGKYALTAEQKQQIDSLRNGFRTQIKPKFKDMWTTRRELMSAMTAPQIDTAKVQELQSKLDEQMVSLSDAKLQNRVAEFQVLTADQRQELKTQFEKKRAEHQARRASRQQSESNG